MNSESVCWGKGRKIGLEEFEIKRVAGFLTPWFQCNRLPTSKSWMALANPDYPRTDGRSAPDGDS